MCILVSLVLSNNVHRQGKHCNHDYKENHKDFQIDNNCFNHCNNITKSFDDFQVKHRFPKAYQQYNNHGNLRNNVLCIEIELDEYVEVAYNDVCKVNVILLVREVFNCSIFEYLHEFIKHRVHQTDTKGD